MLSTFCAKTFFNRFLVVKWKCSLFTAKYLFYTLVFIQVPLVSCGLVFKMHTCRDLNNVPYYMHNVFILLKLKVGESILYKFTSWLINIKSESPKMYKPITAVTEDLNSRHQECWFSKGKLWRHQNREPGGIFRPPPTLYTLSFLPQ